ncbi:MAG: hypothetical protein IIA99_00840, partial [Proteobacteria bacterium]|nr:hypothetical protein [Pseudomonadota bacterium]
RSVAEQAVIACAVVGDVVAQVRALVTRVHGAGYAVVAIDRCTRLATEHRITRLRPVAEQTVVAIDVVRRVDDRVRRLVATVVRARHAVIHRRGHSGLAAVGQAGLRTVAERQVVTKRVVRRELAIQHWIACVRCAGHNFAPVFRTKVILCSGS